jgi:hypothetical protein
MKEEFGCELISINWNHTIENEHTAQVKQCPTPLCVWSENPEATHVFLKPGSEVAFADLPAPTGDVIYYFGRNSQGFRSDLDGLDGLSFASLPGAELWAHEAARAVLET